MAAKIVAKLKLKSIQFNGWSSLAEFGNSRRPITLPGRDRVAQYNTIVCNLVFNLD